MKRFFLALWLLLIPSLVYAGSQQTSGVTAQTVVDNARVYLNETSSGFWSDSQLLRFLNDGMIDIASYSHAVEGTERVGLETGVTHYTIASNYITVKGAIYNAGATTYNKALEEGDIFSPKAGIGLVGDAGEPVYWDEFAGSLYLWPGASSSVSGYTVTLYLVTRPSAITITGTVTTPAIYDKALVYYIVSQALLKDQMTELSDSFYAKYLSEISRFRQDLNEGVKEERKPYS